MNTLYYGLSSAAIAYTMPAKKTGSPSGLTRFEKDITRLEGLVEKIENGTLSLEESLKAFEEGIKLARQCQVALTSAEQKVQQLTEQGGKIITGPMEAPEDGA